MVDRTNEDIMFRSDNNINFKINPREYGIKLDEAKKSEIDLSQFAGMSEIYKEALAPTSVSVGYDPLRNHVRSILIGSGILTFVSRKWRSRGFIKRNS